MRLFLHTIICCCLFTMVLPLVKGAKEELNPSLKKRFKSWFKSNMKRDLHSSLGKGQHNEIQDEPPQEKNADTSSMPTSIKLNVRFRRSTSSSRKSGCKLGTCSYHDMVNKVVDYHKPKDATAPKSKISAGGYGRRRRSLLEALQLALQATTRRRSTEAGQQVHRHKSTRTEA